MQAVDLTVATCGRSAPHCSQSSVLFSAGSGILFPGRARVPRSASRNQHAAEVTQFIVDVFLPGNGTQYFRAKQRPISRAQAEEMTAQRL